MSEFTIPVKPCVSWAPHTYGSQSNGNYLQASGTLLNVAGVFGGNGSAGPRHPDNHLIFSLSSSGFRGYFPDETRDDLIGAYRVPDMPRVAGMWNAGTGFILYPDGMVKGEDWHPMLGAQRFRLQEFRRINLPVDLRFIVSAHFIGFHPHHPQLPNRVETVLTLIDGSGNTQTFQRTIRDYLPPLAPRLDVGFIVGRYSDTPQVTVQDFSFVTARATG